MRKKKEKPVSPYSIDLLVVSKKLGEYRTTFMDVKRPLTEAVLAQVQHAEWVPPDVLEFMRLRN